MRRLLLATHNPAKLVELKEGLKELELEGIQLVSLNDVGVEKEPEETGETFRENSELKARFYAALTGLQTVADDGGLVIPHLGGGPGVKSRRWPGYEASDQELIDYTLLHSKDAAGKQRLAYLETCVTFFDPETKQILFEQEKIKGHIAEKVVDRPTNGYPFRGLFIVEKYNKYYDDLTPQEHDDINHRFIALKRLTKRIKDLI